MNSLFVGRNLIHLQRVDSTNNYTAAAMRQSVMPEGTVVWADEQVGGRGQRGNTWLSEAGKNLTMSLVLCPTFLPVAQQFNLTHAISLGLCDFLKRHLALPAQVKWPNDIYVNDQKIAGILIENSIKGSTLRNAIIGIGLNVNQQDFGGLKTATSLKTVLGQEISVKDCLEHLCECLEVRYLQLKADPSRLYEPYLEALYARNELRWFEVKGERVQATILGVSKAGLLQLEIPGKPMAEYWLKEVILMPEAP